MGFFNFFHGEKLGEPAKVEVLSHTSMKYRVDIQKLLLKNGTQGVGLNIVTKGFLSHSSLPLTLNEQQARELVMQINKALDEK